MACADWQTQIWQFQGFLMQKWVNFAAEAACAGFIHHRLSRCEQLQILPLERRDACECGRLEYNNDES